MAYFNNKCNRTFFQYMAFCMQLHIVLGKLSQWKLIFLKIHMPTKASQLISNAHWHSLVTFAILAPCIQKRMCNSSSSSKSVFIILMTVLRFHEAANNIRILFRGFPIHPPRLLVLASSALFSWISLWRSVVFSRTFTRFFVFGTKGFPRDPNQTGVFVQQAC